MPRAGLVKALRPARALKVDDQGQALAAALQRKIDQSFLVWVAGQMHSKKRPNGKRAQEQLARSPLEMQEFVKEVEISYDRR